jgi:hypothetical protein
MSKLRVSGSQSLSSKQSIQPLQNVCRTTKHGPLPVEWEGGEHTFIGNEINIDLTHGPIQAGKQPLTLQNGLQLTYGQILALGGDFYGLPDNPISDGPNPSDLFTQAFNTLNADPNSVAEAANILQIMQIEIDALNAAIKAGTPPSEVYDKLGDSLSMKWNRATGGGLSDYFPLLPLGRYLKLAQTNWDHFCPYAEIVYRAGHSVAVNMAIAARGSQNPGPQLMLAYAMNAFADHYLSDMFSAGHIRTPRKELYNHALVSKAGSYCSRYMHDEDCSNGLQVSNSHGDKWIAFGDKKFFNEENKQNYTICIKAVQASADEIFRAYKTGVAPQSPIALKFTPNYSAIINNPTAINNPPAMFINGQGTVLRRNSLSDYKTYSWTKNWLVAETLAKLATLNIGKGTPQPISVEGNFMTCCFSADGTHMVANLFSPEEEEEKKKKGYKSVWSDAFPWRNNGDNSWVLNLPGDYNGDGNIEFLQLYQSDNVLMADFYVQGINNQFIQAWRNTSFDNDYTDTTIYDVVNLKGDGTAQLIRYDVNANNNLVLNIFAFKNNVFVPLANATLPYTNYAISNWDYNGDGKEEVVVFHPSNGGLGATIFNWNKSTASLENTSFILGSDMGDVGYDNRSIVIGDIDGDGFDECILVTGLLNTTLLNVYKIDASGKMVLKTSFNLQLNELIQISDFYAGDIDGDGKDEIIMWNSRNETTDPNDYKVFKLNNQGALIQVAAAQISAGWVYEKVHFARTGPDFEDQLYILHLADGTWTVDIFGWDTVTTGFKALYSLPIAINNSCSFFTLPLFIPIPD